MFARRLSLGGSRWCLRGCPERPLVFFSADRHARCIAPIEPKLCPTIELAHRRPLPSPVCVNPHSRFGGSTRPPPLPSGPDNSRPVAVSLGSPNLSLPRPPHLRHPGTRLDGRIGQLALAFIKHDADILHKVAANLPERRRRMLTCHSA